MPTADKSVLILGEPKSGTSILAYKIFDALPAPKQIHFEVTTFGRKSEDPQARLERLLATTKSNSVTKCLIHSELSGTAATLNNCSRLFTHRIWIVRDPRDRLISDLLYSHYWGHEPKKPSRQKVFQRNYSTLLARLEEKEKRPLRWSVAELHVQRPVLLGQITHSQTIRQIILMRLFRELSGKWYFQKYEDLVDGNLKGINEFLGLSLKPSTDVASRFQRVKRSRGYGAWREWFTKSDVEFFKPIFSPFLKKFGYDPNDWELKTPKTLPPELGSQYVRRLREDRTL